MIISPCLNPKKEPLTPEKLRELTGVNYSDEEAEEIIFNVRSLVSVILDVQMELELKEEVNRSGNENPE